MTQDLDNAPEGREDNYMKDANVNDPGVNDSNIDDIGVEVAGSGIGEMSGILPAIEMPVEVETFIEKFSISDTSRELGGVLVGTLEEDKEKRAVVKIVAAIPAEHTEANLSSVKFTAESWEHINAVMESDYPDCKIVGWFHTHPGFGIFLSSWDLFIQRHFFNLPWQIAYVVDPVNLRKGFFGWQNGEIVKIFEDRWEERDEDFLFKNPEEARAYTLSLKKIGIIALIGLVLIAGMVFATFKGKALDSHRKSGVKTEIRNQDKMLDILKEKFTSKDKKHKSDKSKKEKSKK